MEWDFSLHNNAKTKEEEKKGGKKHKEVLNQIW